MIMNESNLDVALGIDETLALYVKIVEQIKIATNLKDVKSGH